MATSIGSIFLDLRASTEHLSKDAAKALGVARKLGNQAALAIAAGAATAATAVAAVWVKTAGDLDKVAKASNNLGVEFGKLRAIQDIGNLAGVTAEEIDNSFRTMRKNLVDAAMGMGRATVALDALGLSASELTALKPEEAFSRIGDALNQIPNSTVRAGLATKVFGDQATKMLEILRDGSAGIDRATAKLEGLGIVMSRVDAAKVEIANDALTELKTIAQGAAEQLTVALAPIIAGVADYMKRAAGETHGFKDSIKSAINVAVQAAGYLGNIWRGWELVLKLGNVAFSKLGEVVLSVVNWVVDSVEWLIQANIDGLNVLIEFAQGAVAKIGGWISTAAGKLRGTMVPGADAAADALQGIADSFQDISNAEAGIKWDGFTGEWRSELRIWEQAFAETVDEFWTELEDLASKPLPKESLIQWVEDVNAAADEAAEAIADAVKPVYDGLIYGPPIEGKGPLEGGRLPRGRETGLSWKFMEPEDLRLFKPIQSALDSFQDSIGGLIRQTITWKDAVLDVAATFATTLIQAFVQAAAQWVASRLLIAAVGKTVTATETGVALAAATALAEAWGLAALNASMATFGAAAYTGAAAYAGALAVGMVAGTAIGTVGAFAGGFLGTSANLGGSALAGSRASGGPVRAGSLYEVNEHGMEFFRPDVSGTVIPLGNSRFATEPVASGPSIVVNQYFENGVTEAQLAAHSQKMKRDTIAGVAEAVSRGGGYRKMIQR